MKQWWGMVQLHAFSRRWFSLVYTGLYKTKECVLYGLRKFVCWNYEIIIFLSLSGEPTATSKILKYAAVTLETHKVYSTQRRGRVLGKEVWCLIRKYFILPSQMRNKQSSAWYWLRSCRVYYPRVMASSYLSLYRNSKYSYIILFWSICTSHTRLALYATRFVSSIRTNHLKIRIILLYLLYLQLLYYYIYFRNNVNVHGLGFYFSSV
jgi:hypothetical protein